MVTYVLLQKEKFTLNTEEAQCHTAILTIAENQSMETSKAQLISNTAFVLELVNKKTRQLKEK